MKPDVMKTTSNKPVDASCCPLCDGDNDCQLCTSAAYKGPCWCMSMQVPEALLERVPQDLRRRACICRPCIEAFHNEPKAIESAPLQQDDYYFDRNNLMVFTATYLLRRGYCCGNGCRHCPYPERP
jgi:hypothetical protein